MLIIQFIYFVIDKEQDHTLPIPKKYTSCTLDHGLLSTWWMIIFLIWRKKWIDNLVLDITRIVFNLLAQLLQCTLQCTKTSTCEQLSKAAGRETADRWVGTSLATIRAEQCTWFLNWRANQSNETRPVQKSSEIAIY